MQIKITPRSEKCIGTFAPSTVRAVKSVRNVKRNVFLSAALSAKNKKRSRTQFNSHFDARRTQAGEKTRPCEAREEPGVQGILRGEARVGSQ